jgi:transcriptional regulator with XRE-family HTH domain
MEAGRLGRACRALRIRRGWRQEDVARNTGLSRQLVAKIESGSIDSVQVGTLRRVTETLGATFDVQVRWHGEGLDRLLDAAHAGLVEAVVVRLKRSGWDSAVEASFARAGERGSIDVFAHHPSTATVLVVEVKSVVPDSQAMIHAIDRKTRLARGLALDRGWTCRSVARLVVVGESTTARRRIESLELTYRTAFPDRGSAVSAWLRSPTGPMSGLLFLPFATSGGTRDLVTGRQRVRRGVRRSTATGSGA